jgi:NAD+ kinase
MTDNASEMTAHDKRRGQKPPKKVHVYFHPKVEDSDLLAGQMTRHLRALGVEAEAVNVTDERVKNEMAQQDMIVVIGGDGTMLRSGTMAAPHGVPVLGVNMGRLGFLPEVQPGEWKGAFARILVGDYWIEERMMLHVEHHRGAEMQGSYEVLNEAVVNRGGVARPVRLRALIDGDELTTYVADGLIVATATGSTAYALAVGGPILPPELKDMLIIPISPHLCLDRAVVLSNGSTLEITVRTDHEAVLNADGCVSIPLEDKDRVCVTGSKYVTRFVRVQDPVYFYRNLTSRITQNPSAGKAK